MYSSIVKDHFANPRNIGELEKPDATGSAVNASDGDRVQLHLAIRNQRIREVRIRVMGCVAAIASASCFSEMIREKTIEAALRISKDELATALGGLPENKMRCSLTCIDALKNALSE